MPASDGGYETIEQLPDAEDQGVDPTVAEVDYWLGAGASQEIASMCVDADLSPDEDISPSSVEGNLRASAVPSSVDEELENRPPQDGRGSPHVNTVDAPLAPPLPDNPFLPLNPYPQFIFPDPMLTNDSVQNDAPKEALPGAHDFVPPRLVVDNLRVQGPSSTLPKDTAKEAHLKALGFGPPGASLGGFEVEAHITHQKTGLSPAKVDYDVPAEDEDSFLFPNSDDSPLADDFTKDIDESREPVPRQQAGRISSPTWNVLNAGFQKIDDTIDDLAIKTGRTRENVISLWKRTQAHECSGSMWNKYQKYFLANREKERRRIGDSRANCKYFFYLNMFSADSDD